MLFDFTNRINAAGNAITCILYFWNQLTVDREL